jgi:hypothetical protein
MLQLESTTLEVDGVSVFPDHADRDQFYFLAKRVVLDKRPDGSPAISLLKWKPAAVQAGVKGGGFLTFQTVLSLPEATRAKIMGRLGALAPSGQARLAPAPIETGTVRCLALNLEGSGGTAATPPPPGAFNAVTKILGATKPSLSGDEVAAFSLVLDQEGATILEKAFASGTEPVGVIYELEYSGLTPDLHVKITADFERIYNHFSASVEAQIYWVKAGIDAGFEKLVQDGAIKIEVIDFSNATDKEAKEKWALDFFKDNLLSKWFEPSLDLGQLKGGAAQAEGLDSVLDRMKKMQSTATKVADAAGKVADAVTKPGDDKAKPADGAAKPADGTAKAADGTAKPPEAGKAESTTKTESGKAADASGKTDTAKAADTTPAKLPAAVLTITSTTPSPAPGGRGVKLVPNATTTTTETLEVTSPAGAVLTVDSQVKALDGNGRATVEVAAGSSHTVAVDWPASPAVTETFKLFFTFDQPHEAGFAPTSSNPVFNSYLQNKPTPPDLRFSQSTAPGKTAPLGADALKDWLDNRLIEPKQVTMTSHASWENKSTDEATIFNQRLSERRHAIAKGIIANRAKINDDSKALGFTRAQAAKRIGAEDDRVSEITGKVPGQDPAVNIKGTLTRAAAPPPPPPPTPTPTPPPKETPKPTPTPTPAPTASGGGGTPALVSFKMKFVHQEEKKTLTVEYDRKKAVKRVHAPQGFIGLLLDELPDKAKHFVEIDLDDPFFRVLAVDIATPADFARIGLFSTDVAIDYGNPADPQNHRHEEFRLTAADRGPKRFETFLNAAREIGFRAGFQHHFAADSGWIGERLTYEIEPRETTDRTLNVDPGNDLGFLELQIFPNRIDAGIIEAIDVRMSYDDGATFQRADTFRVLPTSAPQFWRLRLTKAQARTWQATFTHHLRNGDQRTTGPISSDASVLPVDDPFEGALDIRAIPLFPPDTVRQVFVDVTYEDAANNYRREERLEIPGNATAPVPLRIGLLNPALRTFRHRITIVTIDGRLIQGPPIDGAETLLGVGQLT